MVDNPDDERFARRDTFSENDRNLLTQPYTRQRVVSFDSHRAPTIQTAHSISQNDLLNLKECRICFQSDSLTSNQHQQEVQHFPNLLSRSTYSQNRLINPCLCRGTMAYVHEQCLLRWLQEKRRRHCELCSYPLPVRQVFNIVKCSQLVWADIKYIGSRQDRLVKVVLQAICVVIYIKHFIPVVRCLRTKMLRDLCKLWMIFEQEEKLREATREYTCRMKVKQVITQEIPITIKLMIFMWVLRKFVSIGGKYLYRIVVFLYQRWYVGAKEMRFFVDNNLKTIQQAQIAAVAARVRANSSDNNRAIL